MNTGKASKHLHIIVLAIIVIFSFALRFYSISTNPAGFFCDEASTGYDALNILQTGKDRHGDFLPLFFKGFNYDNVSPFQVYLTVPFVALFGLNETAVRLTPIFWSMVELIVFYFLLRKFMPKWFALVGLVMLSISPWHFHISRINMGDFYSWTLLTLTAYYFLVENFRHGRVRTLILSSLFLGLTTYSYTPARLVTPLFFSFILIIIFLKKNIKHTLVFGAMYCIMLIPFIHFHLTNPHSFQRIKDTMGIDLKNKTEPYANSSISIQHITKKYIDHYSVSFLFQKGDTDFPGQFIRRHSIPGIGLLYPYQAFFIVVGLIWLVVLVFKNKKTELLPILFLLVIFPLADSLTSDKTPFSTRSYLGIIPFHFLIAFGVFGAYQFFLQYVHSKKVYFKSVYLIIILLLIISSLMQLITHFNSAPQTTSDYWGWQYGAKDIVHYFTANESEYDQLIMAPEFNAPEIFFKFYAPNDCKKCIVGLPDANYNPGLKQLFAVTPAYLENHPLYKFSTKKIIYYPNRSIAFKIGGLVQ